MREDRQNEEFPLPDRANTVAHAVSRRGSAVSLNVEKVTPVKHHRGLDDQGLVIAQAGRWNTSRA